MCAKYHDWTCLSHQYHMWRSISSVLVLLFRLSSNMTTNTPLFPTLVSVFFLMNGPKPNLVMWADLSCPHMKVGETELILSLEVYEWWFAIVSNPQITSAFSVGTELRIDWMLNDCWVEVDACTLTVSVCSNTESWVVYLGAIGSNRISLMSSHIFFCAFPHACAIPQP